jgi:hypothetical protein
MTFGLLSILIRFPADGGNVIDFERRGQGSPVEGYVGFGQEDSRASEKVRIKSLSPGMNG